MSDAVQYLENFGREDLERPPDLQWLAKELPGPLDVTLRVDDTGHWFISWISADNDLNNPAMRVIEIVRENGKDHLTNWGPITKSKERKALDTAHTLHLGTLTLKQREDLEAIAGEHPVQVPDGVYDCRTWIEQVVREGVKKDILNEQIADKVLDEAYAILPPSSAS